MEISLSWAKWRPAKPWMIHYRPEGAKGPQRRLFYAKKDDAETAQRDLRKQYGVGGVQALVLTATQMREYHDAKALVAPADLVDVAREWRARVARPDSPTLPDALNAFLAEQRATNSERYATGLKAQLWPMVERIGIKVRFDRVTAAQIEEALRIPGVPVALETLAARRRQFGTFVTWGRRKQWRDDDPLLQVRKIRVPRPTPEFFTVPQTKALLCGVAERAPWLLPAVALRLFAGVRSYEVKAMAKGWPEDVQPAQERILVRAEVAKGQKSRPRPRLIEGLPRPVWRWLALSELVWPTWGDEMLRTAIGEAAPRLRNGMRHTFGTYAAAYFESYEKTARLMGNSAEMVRTHYAGLATKAQAEEFFALDPRGWRE